MAEFNAFRSQYGAGGSTYAGGMNSSDRLVRDQMQRRGAKGGMKNKYVPGASADWKSYSGHDPGLSGAASVNSRYNGRAGERAHDDFLKSKYKARMKEANAAKWFKRGESVANASMRAAGTMGRLGYQGAALAGRAITSQTAKKAYGVMNSASTKIFGGSIPQIGAVAGLGMLAYGALATDPAGDVKAAGRFLGSMGDQMKAASRPTYGTTVFNQSTQGLVFGLHSRRNG